MKLKFFMLFILMYKYKYQKYIDKLNFLMGGNDGNNGLIYLLVTTEFKKTEQKLGKLEEFSKKTSEFISSIDDYLSNIVSNIPNVHICASVKDRDTSLLIEEIKKMSIVKKQIENNVLAKIGEFFDPDDKITIDNFIIFMKNRDYMEMVIKSMGIDNYDNMVLGLKMIKLLNYELSTISYYIKIKKEEEKDRLKIFQSKMEENALINSDVRKMYENSVIKGSEFRAMILNHHFITEPYIHVVYTVLKYDIVKKKIYVDIFVSNRQFIKSSSIRMKEFIPKMFDENMSDGGFADNYAKKIYEIMKKNIDDVSVLDEKINILNDYIYRESNELIDHGSDRIKLKLQKNMVQYLSGLTPIDDNQTKVKLCNLRTPPSTLADEKYRYVVENTKRIVKERKILGEKSYTVIATTIKLLERDEIHEKKGEEDKHAEAILIQKYHDNEIAMNHFKMDDLIYVIRLYQNGNIGCGLPCNRCVRVLHGNGVKRVIYSMDIDHYRTIDMDETTYTYTTTGNKLLNIDMYLYDDFIVSKRPRNVLI